MGRRRLIKRLAAGLRFLEPAVPSLPLLPFLLETFLDSFLDSFLKTLLKTLLAALLVAFLVAFVPDFLYSSCSEQYHSKP